MTVVDNDKVSRVIRAAGEAKVVAAVKSRTVEDILELKRCGVKIVGENRVQELLSKYGEDGLGLEWHFIGNLQTNKVKYIVDKVSMIQSVDREALGLEIDKQCARRGIVMDILVEVNMGEESKGGVALSELEGLLSFVSGLKFVSLKGLMFIPPLGSGAAVYKKIQDIFNLYKDKFCLKYLSAGMSGDYELALECGANIIRPGSILFSEGGKK